MRFIYFLLLFVAASHSVSYAQQTPRDSLTARVNRLCSLYTDYAAKKEAEIAEDSSVLMKNGVRGRFFSRAAFISFFDKYFTLLNYGRTSFTEGNSASVSTTEKDTRLNIILSYKNKASIFSVGTGLKVGEGTGKLFSGGNLTTGAQFSLSHSFLLPGQSLHYFVGTADGNKKRNYEARHFVIDSLRNQYCGRNPHYIHHLLNAADSFETVIAQQEERLNTASTHEAKTIHSTLAALYAARAKTRDELRSLNAEEDPSSVMKDVQSAGDKRGIEKELQTTSVSNFTLKWFSYGLSYQRDDYSTWDSTLTLPVRLGAQAFNKWSFTAGYNRYWSRTTDFMNWAKFRVFLNAIYFGASYTLERSNNFSDIDEQDFAIRKYATTNDSTYELITAKKVRNISGRKFDKSFTSRMALQGTLLFGKKGFWGLNLKQNVELSKLDPVLNSHAGVVFRFYDSEKETSRANFEIYLDLKDLSDAKGKGTSAWKRREIGVTTTIPFQKVFFQ